VQANAEASKQAVGGKNRRRSNLNFKSQKQRPVVEYTGGVEEEPRRLLPPPCMYCIHWLVMLNENKIT